MPPLPALPRVADPRVRSGLLRTAINSTLSVIASLTVGLLAPSTASAAIKWHPGHYMLEFLSDSQATRFAHYDLIAENPSIQGVQVRFEWRQLEAVKNDYSAGIALIQAELDKLTSYPNAAHPNGLKKRLVLQIMDRRFNLSAVASNPRSLLPDYLLDDPQYNGGYASVTEGSKFVIYSQNWTPAVMDRLIALYTALGTVFDRHPYFEGVTTEETAQKTPLTAPAPYSANYSGSVLTTQVMRLYSAARLAWPTSNVFAFTNWGNADRLVQHAFSVQVGVGGPDVLPDDAADPTLGIKAILGKSPQPPGNGVDYRGLTPIAFAVQTPDYESRTHTATKIFEYAKNTLRANYLFWIRKTGGGTAEQQWDPASGGPGILAVISNPANTLVSTIPVNLGGVPNAPSGLTATIASASQVNLSWQDNASNETGFVIDRATNSNFTTGPAPITGAYTTGPNPTLPFAAGNLSAGTTYYFRIRATNNVGDSANSNSVSVTTAPASDTTAPAPVVESRLSNVSVRTTLAAAQTLIVGFTMQGGAKPVLLRAVGPGLATLGVAGATADPKLLLFKDATLLAQNDNWGGDASLRAQFASVGAFALADSSLDAALVRTVEGGHTAQISGPAAGNVLVEAYDAGPGSSPHLSNVSARNFVGTGGDLLIAGFTLAGTGSTSLLVRAVGPALAGFGVPASLIDPKLAIYNSAGAKIAENDNWSSALASVFASVGAFALTPGSGDAALTISLPPGGYTVQVSGASGTTGEALVELYELPKP